MNQEKIAQNASSSLYRMNRIVVLGMTFTVLLALLLSNTFIMATAKAEGRPGGNVEDPEVRAVVIAKPAVVRIATTIFATVTVRMKSGETVKFPQGSSTSENAVGSNYAGSALGSGTFISSQGDILTADHVINPPKDDSLALYFYQVAAPDIALYLNEHGEKGTTAEDVENQLKSGQLRGAIDITKTESVVFLSTDYTGPLDASSFRELPDFVQKPVDKVYKESSIEDKDMAIIHAAFTDTPHIQLGDSSSVQQQDNLTIIGFPGNGDVSDTPTNMLTSSVNKITVSSIKTTNNGTRLIQVGGNVEHGDSGGPALDSKGTVVGIVSFGLDSGGRGNTSFLQTSNYAREWVEQLGLDTKPGPLQKLWNDAMNAYASNEAGHWHKALDLFNQIEKKYPDFKAIKSYQDYTEKQAATEKVPTTNQNQPVPALFSSPITLAITIAVIAFVALLCIVLAYLVIRSGNRRKVQPAPFAGGAPYSTGFVNAPPQGQYNQFQGYAPVPQPGQQQAPSQFDNSMYAFGAPPSPAPSSIADEVTVRRAPVPQQSQPNSPMAQPVPQQQPASSSAGLSVWPCGHSNRPEARFCGVCGEPAPHTPPPPHHVEQ